MNTKEALLVAIGVSLLWMAAVGLGWTTANGGWWALLQNTAFAAFGFFFFHQGIKRYKFPKK